MRRVGQLVMLATLGFSAVLLCAIFLVSLRLEKAVGDLVEERANLIALQMTNAIEGGLRLGILVSDQSETRAKMQSILHSDQEVLTIALFDDTGRSLLIQSRDDVLHKFDQHMVRRVLDQRANKSAKGATRAWRAMGQANVMLQVLDATGSKAALIWVVYSASTAQKAFTAVFQELLHASFIMLVAAACTLYFLIALVWHSWEEHVVLVQTSLDAGLTADKSIGQINPLPVVPLREALIQIANAERQLQVLDQQVAALSK